MNNSLKMNSLFKKRESETEFAACFAVAYMMGVENIFSFLHAQNEGYLNGISF